MHPCYAVLTAGHPQEKLARPENPRMAFKGELSSKYIVKTRFYLTFQIIFLREVIEFCFQIK